MTRYYVQIFDLNARRLTGDHRDGTYEDVNPMIIAVRDALEDGNIGSILIRDQLRIDETKPRPLGDILGATENVGSCEPDPLLVRWDKTHDTWHTDTKAGRYSVRRRGKRQPFQGYFVGKEIAGAQYSSTSVDNVKSAIEMRIRAAARIAKSG